MSKKGMRKYRCYDCHEESYHHWMTKNRAGRLRCPGCGSIALDLCSPKGKAEVSKVHDLGKTNAGMGKFAGPGKNLEV